MFKFILMCINDIEMKDDIVFFPHQYFVYFFVSKDCRGNIHLFVQVQTALTHCVLISYFYILKRKVSWGFSPWKVHLEELNISTKFCATPKDSCHVLRSICDRGLFPENSWGVGNRRLQWPRVTTEHVPCEFSYNIMLIIHDLNACTVRFAFWVVRGVVFISIR